MRFEAMLHGIEVKEERREAEQVELTPEQESAARKALELSIARKQQEMKARG